MQINLKQIHSGSQILCLTFSVVIFEFKEKCDYPTDYFKLLNLE